MDRLNLELREQAIKNGLCDVWQADWKEDKTPQELIDMYIKGIDFAVKHDYPSVDFIKDNFDIGLLHDNSIYVDEDVHVSGSQNGTFVLNGKCSGVLSFDKFSAVVLYIRHQSDVVVKVSGFSRVFVNVHDAANVHVEQYGTSKAYVYKHGHDCQVHTRGDVKVRERNR